MYLGYEVANPSNVNAIKILKNVTSDKIKTEVSILKRLEGHPNIIQLYDVVVNPATDFPALVMEFVDAGEIEREDLYDEFDNDDVQYYMYKLLTAVDYAHSKGIMHRDIKPGNIMIDDKEGDLKLVDWGLADYFHMD